MKNKDDKINNLDITRFISDICSIRGVKIYNYNLHDKTLEVYCSSKYCRASCPLCKNKSSVVRSNYIRKLISLPIGSHKTIIYLKTRKFKCDNDRCIKKIFSEQNSKICEKYSRKTKAVKDILCKILIEVSSVKGSYLLSSLNMPCSSSTCLRVIHQMPFHKYIIPECIGIDDWAKKKGQSYGTIIVNSESGKVIDLINSRNYEDLLVPLESFKDVSYVTRDRARCYSKAISTSIPNAKQIADKFHLSKNLSDTIHNEIKLSYSKIRNNYIAQISSNDIKVNKEEEKATTINTEPQKPVLPTKTTRMKFIFEEVKELQQNGVANREIARRFKISRTTVRRFSRMEHYTYQVRRYKNNYEAYLETIYSGINENLPKSKIHEKMCGLGFKGNLSSFLYWLRLNFPEYKTSESSGSSTKYITETKKAWYKFNRMTVKRLSIHVCNPDYGVCKETGLISDDNILCNDIIKSDNTRLTVMRDIYVSFRALLSNSGGINLDTWAERAKETGIKGIASFAKGLLNYREEIENAIKYEWTNGVVEGNVNRLKNKKREMYGRASFALLRKKVCMSYSG